MSRVKFRVDQADAITGKHGLTNLGEKAAFFGVTHHNYSRVVHGVNGPGEEFIAAVLGSRPDDPDVTFDRLFEVVPA